MWMERVKIINSENHSPYLKHMFGTIVGMIHDPENKAKDLCKVHLDCSCAEVLQNMGLDMAQDFYFLRNSLETVGVDYDNE